MYIFSGERNDLYMKSFVDLLLLVLHDTHTKQRVRSRQQYIFSTTTSRKARGVRLWLSTNYLCFVWRQGWCPPMERTLWRAACVQTHCDGRTRIPSKQGREHAYAYACIIARQTRRSRSLLTYSSCSWPAAMLISASVCYYRVSLKKFAARHTRFDSSKSSDWIVFFWFHAYTFSETNCLHCSSARDNRAGCMFGF